MAKNKRKQGKRPLVIYHGNCPDGFMAALAFWRHYPSWEYLPGLYSPDMQLPDVVGRIVILLDFCYPEPVLQELCQRADMVYVFDHHKTAQDILSRFTAPNLFSIIDMEQSGAGLAWRLVQMWQTSVTNVQQEIPELVKRVEDYDLWRFAYDDTRMVQAALLSYPYDFKVWNTLVERPLTELAIEGIGIHRTQQKHVDDLISAGTMRVTIAGINVPVVNAPYMFASDIGAKLAINAPFAAIYYDVPEGRKWSLRSAAPDGADVAAIAQQFGGGGHKHAAGFITPLSWFGDVSE